MSHLVFPSFEAKYLDQISIPEFILRKHLKNRLFDIDLTS